MLKKFLIMSGIISMFVTGICFAGTIKSEQCFACRTPEETLNVLQFIRHDDTVGLATYMRTKQLQGRCTILDRGDQVEVIGTKNKLLKIKNYNGVWYVFPWAVIQ